MPWSVQRDDRCPAAKPWGVVKQTDGALEGCHPSRQAGLKQAAALYASERMKMDDDPEDLGYERRVSSLTWPFLDFDIRTEQDGMRFRGYAAVFNSPSEPLPFIETIRETAFVKTLRDRRTKKMFLNHNQDIVLGSTRKSLKLSTDKRGLLAELDLPNNEWGRPIADAIRREDIDGMSFGFTAIQDAWDGPERRELVEVDLHEVSLVTGFPAYSDTTVAIRNVVVPVALSFERREKLEAVLAALGT